MLFNSWSSFCSDCLIFIEDECLSEDEDIRKTLGVKDLALFFFEWIIYSKLKNHATDWLIDVINLKRWLYSLDLNSSEWSNRCLTPVLDSGWFDSINPEIEVD